MRTLLLICAAAWTAATGSSVCAQPPAAFAETPGTKRADEALTEAVDAATQAYTRSREKELADWLRGYEKALASAKAAGDPDAVDYLAEAIARSMEAGFVVKPPPPGAVKYGKHSYARFSEELPWYVAKRRCESMGGHLVTIESAGEADFLVTAFGKEWFWIGAGDFEQEGDYRWLDGSPFQAFDYRSGFDDNGGGQHAILWAVKEQCWDDGDEGVPVSFVCEWDR